MPVVSYEVSVLMRNSAEPFELNGIEHKYFNQDSSLWTTTVMA